jgi:glycosyltransferase involved in cell wall biosynthesis
VSESAGLPRVLFVNHTGSLGGAELVMLDLAAHLRDRCTVLLLSHGPLAARLREAGVEVQTLPAGPALLDVRRDNRRLSAGTVAEIFSVARRAAPVARTHDVVYANSQKALVVGGVTAAFARRPFIWHLHDIMNRQHFSGFNIRAAVVLANILSTRVITISEAAAEAFRAEGGNARKLRVVYNGIDPEPFLSVKDSEAAELRRSLGLADVPLVGLFSRLSPWKGQDILLRALARLDGVHGLFVGDALFGEEAYKTGLAALARQLGVEDRAHFVGFRRDIPVLMRAVDVVVHASTSVEPFGRVIVEGMLSGRPVIATRGGGTQEVMEDDATGVFVKPGDGVGLAVAIQRLLADPEERDRLAAAGRRSALANFSLRSMVDGVARQIAEVCAPAPSRAAAS